MRVLIVDDEEDLRFVMRFVLELEGFEVFEAVDGLSALVAIDACVPDLVITDRMMPGLDGSSLIGRLREDERTRALPLIMWSANPDLSADADLHLLKTTGMDDLKLAVRRLAATQGDRA